MVLRRLVLMLVRHPGWHGLMIVRARLAGKHRRHGKARAIGTLAKKASKPAQSKRHRENLRMVDS
jgi:hypothetical protein